MIKPTIINILGQPNGILDLKKGFGKTFKNTSCKRGFAEDCLEVYENRADHLKNNLILQEISILIFFQFHCKINRSPPQIVVETTYVLNPY